MLSFHHLGVATRSIAGELSLYVALGYVPTSSVFIDEIQGIRGQFLTAPQDTLSPKLELLENLHESGPLDASLRNGIKVYHMAYISSDIARDAALLAACGGKIIQPIHEAVFFTKICFIMLRNRQLIELVVPRN